jgi:hypothetical protein
MSSKPTTFHQWVNVKTCWPISLFNAASRLNVSAARIRKGRPDAVPAPGVNLLMPKIAQHLQQSFKSMAEMQ